MHQNLPVIGGRTLKQLAIPGTHDAGMSSITGHTVFGTPCDTITQSETINGQLRMGSRYFDIRPVISKGEFYTGHYGFIKELKMWQGANGQSIDDVIDDINDFTKTNAELIILNLSHDLDTDVGGKDFEQFNDDQWHALFTKLTRLSHLFVAPNPTSVDLTSLTLNQYIGHGTAAVVVIVETPAVDMGVFSHWGFYTYPQLNAYNVYTSTHAPFVSVALTDNIVFQIRLTWRRWFPINWRR